MVSVEVSWSSARRKGNAKALHCKAMLAVALFVGLLGLPASARAQQVSCYTAQDFKVCPNGDGTLSYTFIPAPLVTAQVSAAPRQIATSAGHGATTYDGLIVEHARANNVRPDLVRAVVSVESAFNPHARSPKGALGLMQLMPATARQFNVSNPFDPDQNIRAGSAYLRQLLDRYDGSEALALAAYNAGPGAVAKYGQSIPPYRETRQYVSRVTDIAGEDEGAAAPVTPAGTPKIYKVIEIINGQPVTTYTTRKPR